MLEQPMMDKLAAMRLDGIADALKAQQQDPAMGELSFLERLGLLVDHQFAWRQNQALAKRLARARLRANTCVENIDYRTSRGLDKSVLRALTQQSAWVANHENIFVMGEDRAIHQDIRPLKIAILNLMPTKIATETQLLRLLGNTPLQVEVTDALAVGPDDVEHQAKPARRHRNVGEVLAPRSGDLRALEL